MTGTVIIARRFNGPPGSAQGGYACGRLATVARQWLGPEQVVVTLHEPPPLDTPLRPEPAGSRVHFWDREQLIASVTRSRAVIVQPAFTPPRAAAVAEQAYVAVGRHPFASCFVCGPSRTDGLRLAPGELAPGMTGCRWRPDTSLCTGPDDRVSAEFAWAALDCPGGWTVDLAAAPMVLSRFCAEIIDLPIADAEHVIVGRRDAYDDRTLTTTTALYCDDGRLIGKAVAAWARVRLGSRAPSSHVPRSGQV